MNNMRIRHVACIYKNIMKSSISSYSNYAILGIETSCDDTGCAIINGDGNLLSETLYSQHLMHIRNGGIIPDVAQDLHRQYIEPLVSETLSKASLHIRDINAIAVTVKPGLALSLAIGMKYAKHLARLHCKPLIPIHHMEAHALAIRINHDIPFPYLVLLVSGGHCLLAVVNDVNKFLLLGESIDIAPGEAFDKVARHMKLKNIPELSQLSGGQAIELAALKAKNPNLFQLPLPITDYKDCNFSFNGLKTSSLYRLHQKEKEHNIVANSLIPEVNDLCAGILLAVAKHLVHRTQRAMEFCEIKSLLPKTGKVLAVSGGVACNNIIFKSLERLCSEMNYTSYRPAPKLCTDNGVMIAWNGLEKWRRKIDIMTDLSKIDIEPRAPLGINLISEVTKARLQTEVLKLKDIL